MVAQNNRLSCCLCQAVKEINPTPLVSTGMHRDRYRVHLGCEMSLFLFYERRCQQSIYRIACYRLQLQADGGESFWFCCQEMWISPDAALLLTTSHPVALTLLSLRRLPIDQLFTRTLPNSLNCFTLEVWKLPLRIQQHCQNKTISATPAHVLGYAPSLWVLLRLCSSTGLF
jgi:hypothetical protein